MKVIAYLLSSKNGYYIILKCKATKKHLGAITRNGYDERYHGLVDEKDLDF